MPKEGARQRGYKSGAAWARAAPDGTARQFLNDQRQIEVTVPALRRYLEDWGHDGAIDAIDGLCWLASAVFYDDARDLVTYDRLFDTPQNCTCGVCIATSAVPWFDHATDDEMHAYADHLNEHLGRMLARYQEEHA